MGLGIEQELVSIIVPVYNSEKCLPETLYALINQSYQNIEVIVIDDGSDDASFEVCLRYQKKDSRIKAIRRENAGVSSTRNYGIQLAKGKFIVFCDSDDIPEVQWCEWLVKNYREGYMLMSSYSIWNGEEKRKVIVDLIQDKTGIYEKEKFYFFYHYFILNSPWNKVYSRQMIEKNGIKFNEKITLGEDLIFNLQYLDYCKGIFYLNLSSYNYRINENSLTHSSKINLKENYFKVFTEIFKRFELYGTNIEDIAEILQEDIGKFTLEALIQGIKQEKSLKKSVDVCRQIYRTEYYKYLLEYKKRVNLNYKMKILLSLKSKWILSILLRLR